MQGGRVPRGFTIVEIMIFLAVSGLILMGALLALNGKQNETEFHTAMNNLVSNLQRTVSYVSDGYYETPQGLQCTSTGGAPNISSSGGQQGQNFGCIMIGEVLEFGVSNSAGQEYDEYPVAGLQYVGGTPPTVTTNISQAEPTALYPAVGPTVNEFGYGLNVHSICYGDSGYNPGPSSATCSYLGANNYENVGAVGLFTSFNGYNAAIGNGTSLNEGSQSIQIIPIPGSTLGLSSASVEPYINKLCNSSNTSNSTCATTAISQSYVTEGSGSPSAGVVSVINPDKGLNICIDSGSTNQSAQITVGGSNGPSVVSLKYFSGTGC